MMNESLKNIWDYGYVSIEDLSSTFIWLSRELRILLVRE
jgi:hypothetical protein